MTNTKNHHNTQGSQRNRGGQAKLTQGTNPQPNVSENVDALKSQTIEPHSLPDESDSAYSRYH